LIQIAEQVLEVCLLGFGTVDVVPRKLIKHTKCKVAPVHVVKAYSEGEGKGKGYIHSYPRHQKEVNGQATSLPL